MIDVNIDKQQTVELSNGFIGEGLEGLKGLKGLDDLKCLESLKSV